MIALLGAMSIEVSGLMKSMTAARRTSSPAGQIMEGELAGRRLLLARTGIGRERALAASQHVLENYPVTGMVSFGFGGALAAGLQVGDLLVCPKLYCDSHPGAAVHKSDSRLLQLAAQAMTGRATPRLLTGDALTMDQVVVQPAEKLALGQAYQAQVVDMESYWVAQAAAGRQVPFLGVRAISDALQERLPPFDRFLDPQGKWLLGAALGHFLTTDDLLKLPGMFLHARQARASLDLFLRALIPLLDGEV